MTTQYNDSNMIMNRHDIAYKHMVNDSLKTDFVPNTNYFFKYEIAFYHYCNGNSIERTMF